MRNEGLSQQARQLIDESVQTDSIIHHPYSRALAADLHDASDDGVDTVSVAEYWGAEGERTWRVHLDKPAAEGR